MGKKRRKNYKRKSSVNIRAKEESAVFENEEKSSQANEEKAQEDAKIVNKDTRHESEAPNANDLPIDSECVNAEDIKVEEVDIDVLKALSGEGNIAKPLDDFDETPVDEDTSADDSEATIEADAEEVKGDSDKNTGNVFANAWAAIKHQYKTNRHLLPTTIVAVILIIMCVAAISTIKTDTETTTTTAWVFDGAIDYIVAETSEDEEIIDDVEEIVEEEIVEEVADDDEAEETEEETPETTEESSEADTSDTAEETTTTTSAHTHNWSPLYTTVSHAEVSHTEDQGYYQTVVVQEAYDEEVYTTITSIECACGESFSASTSSASLTLWEAHATEMEANEDYSHSNYSSSSEDVLVATIHHDEVTEQRWVSNIVTVVDEEAYEEQILYGYECTSCGTMRSAD